MQLYKRPRRAVWHALATARLSPPTEYKTRTSTQAIGRQTESRILEQDNGSNLSSTPKSPPCEDSGDIPDQDAALLRKLSANSVRQKPHRRRHHRKKWLPQILEDLFGESSLPAPLTSRKAGEPFSPWSRSPRPALPTRRKSGESLPHRSRSPRPASSTPRKAGKPSTWSRSPRPAPLKPRKARELQARSRSPRSASSTQRKLDDPFSARSISSRPLKPRKLFSPPTRLVSLLPASPSPRKTDKPLPARLRSPRPVTPTLRTLFSPPARLISPIPASPTPGKAEKLFPSRSSSPRPVTPTPRSPSPSWTLFTPPKRVRISKPQREPRTEISILPWRLVEIDLRIPRLTRPPSCYLVPWDPRALREVTPPPTKTRATQTSPSGKGAATQTSLIKSVFSPRKASPKKYRNNIVKRKRWIPM